MQIFNVFLANLNLTKLQSFRWGRLAIIWPLRATVFWGLEHVFGLISQDHSSGESQIDQYNKQQYVVGFLSCCVWLHDLTGLNRMPEIRSSDEVISTRKYNKEWKKIWCGMILGCFLSLLGTYWFLVGAGYGLCTARDSRSGCGCTRSWLRRICATA